MAGEEEGRDKFHGATRRVVVGEKRRHENGREGKGKTHRARVLVDSVSVF